MYRAYITKVKNIRPAENADRLNLVDVFGTTTVVDKTVNINDLYIYFPVEGQISQEFGEANDLFRRKDENGKQCGGFIDPNKRNITAIRLRGNKSDGLILPLTALEKFGDISKLKEGDTVETFNGHTIAVKYIPIKKNKGNTSQGNKTRKKVIPIAPLFKEHADTEQFEYNINDFNYGDLIDITLKLHGTSGRTAYLPVLKGYKKTFWDKLLRREGTPIYNWDIVSGTRRVVLDTFDGGFYGSNAFREKYNDFFKGKLFKGEEIFYEIVGFTDEGTPIMGEGKTSKLGKEFEQRYGKTMVFSYGCSPIGDTDKEEGFIEAPKNDIYVYRMTMTNEDGDVVEYTPDYMRYRCEQMGVKTVPVLEQFYLRYGDPAEPKNKVMQAKLKSIVESWYEGPDLIDPRHIREGVVVRIVNRPKFTAYKAKGFDFKVISGIIKETTNIENMSEDELGEL